MVDDDGIGVGYIQSGFDDGSCYQDVIFTVYKFQHHVFQVVTFQLAVCYTNTCFWNQFVDQPTQLRQVNHAVMDKKYLSSAVYLMLNCFFDQRIIKNMQFGNNGLPVWRRGGYDG